MEGTIIKNISNDYTVQSNNNIYICKARGKFKKDKIVPKVGDKVTFDEKNNYILKIHKRKNSLIRPNVANVDQALVVTSVKQPNLDTNLLDKLLTIISYNNIEPIICFTKLDLLSSNELEEINKYIDYYKKIGYTVVTNTKKENFKNIFDNKITVLTGQSGAGKSSLLNFLNPNLKLKTNEISKALNRGKHTTRHTELYYLLNGYIVDTPGFSNVDFHNMEKTAIRDNMKEMFDNLHNCKYRDCMHIKEEGCAVKKLLEDNNIMPSRYNNYKQFIESIDKTKK
ncbi:MAG: ribosome small subunit-dependent GTPase A [Bacilli bacterium]|nr:ribosome small subunit-dependent GTPase A [Bacilli bacterium]